MKSFLIATLALALSACISVPGHSQNAPAAPLAANCPEAIVDAKCLKGSDVNGSFYWIAIPTNWNQKLIVHSHGGPRRKTPELDDSKSDLERFSIFVNQGFAWIGTSYRRGGYGVRMAAADTETSRQIFWHQFGKPKQTILHGQSWGANVAAKVSELYAISPDGEKNYDGVLLTNGVIAGGTKAYQFRADLRAIYQYYCKNLPLPNETQYPVWQGLGKDSNLSQREFRERLNSCTGLNLPANQRSSVQKNNLSNILSLTGIEESYLDNHLSWSVFLFQDIVHKRLGGKNPFDNSQKVYRGSQDDSALNAGIERFKADKEALANLSYDADLSGMIVIPTLSIHAIHDAIANFEMEKEYAKTIEIAGNSDLLFQVATTENTHEKLSDAEYASAISTLSAWIESKVKPSNDDIKSKCNQLSQTIKGGCYIK